MPGMPGGVLLSGFCREDCDRLEGSNGVFAEGEEPDPRQEDGLIEFAKQYRPSGSS